MAHQGFKAESQEREPRERDEVVRAFRLLPLSRLELRRLPPVLTLGAALSLAPCGRPGLSPDTEDASDFPPIKSW